MRHVIIGNSYASVFAMESIRKLDSNAEILAVSYEPYNPYARAAIHEYMFGAIGEIQMYYRGDDFYEKNNIQPLLSKKVISLDAKKRRINLDDGKKINFDRLLICTGSVPIFPPIAGAEGTKGVFTFIKWDDAKSLAGWVKAQKSPKAVVLGGGLIGLQCAEGLRQMGVDVTVVELADFILIKAIDRRAAGIVQKKLMDNRIKIITGDTVSFVQKVKGMVSGVKLKSGEKISCNTFVVSIGVRPNVEFLKDSGLSISRGIVVNDRMGTNIEGIYAAGDVAEAREVLSGKNENIPIIPIATMQGKVAGYNMSGTKRLYAGGLSQNSLQFFGLNVISIGNITMVSDTDSCKEIIRDESGVYKKAVLKNGRLIYILSVNQIERIGIFNSIIRANLDVSGIKDALLKDDFGWTDLPLEFRKEMLTKPG